MKAEVVEGIGVTELEATVLDRFVDVGAIKRWYVANDEERGLRVLVIEHPDDEDLGRRPLAIPVGHATAFTNGLFIGEGNLRRAK